MCLLLTTDPASTAEIAESTAKALEKNESQALIVLAVIGGAIVVIAILAFVFRKKKPPPRR